MKILKRSGDLEEFNPEKIKVSLENSARDIEFVLTQSDLNIILSDVKSILNNIRKEDENTSVYELRGIVYLILIKHNFNDICKAFMFYKKL